MGGGIKPLDASHSYYFSSHGNCNIAEIVFGRLLSQGTDLDEVTWISLQNVIGLALETSLKHFLINRGFDRRKLLSKEYGHRLEVLLGESKALGIQEAGHAVGQPGLYDALAKIVLLIGKEYGVHDYRYLKSTEFAVFQTSGSLRMIVQAIRCVLSLPVPKAKFDKP
jgi:hypothetical protein